MTSAEDAGQPVESREDLIRWFREGEKPRERWRVGTEHEKIGLLGDTLERIPYEGERGIAAFLERLAEVDDQAVVRESGRPIALLQGEASVTLEPGGQLELSGAPLATLAETAAEIDAHLDLVKRVSEPFGFVWLGLGVDPFHTAAETPHVPKTRYTLMREALPSRGELAMEMMHSTATVQANLDYADEADMARKLATAYAVTPVVSALYANSSLSGGKPNGFVSRRMHVWTRTDPDRCGLPPWVFEGGPSYEAYTEWALDVPMLFLVRDGVYLRSHGASFRRFLERGLDGHRATLADWEVHLTTLFPEVRLKRFIEVRGADAGPAPMLHALPALWKGLLYDDDACAAAPEGVRGWDRATRLGALDAVARSGLAAQVGGRSLLDLARALVDVAAEGLRRIEAAGGPGVGEVAYLDPLYAQLEQGRSPGRVVLDRWEGEWARTPMRLIDQARY